MQVFETVEDKISKKPFKIGIVGPSEEKWKNPEQYEAMKNKIHEILECAHASWLESLKAGEQDRSAPILVSGHCPIGEERWYCTSHNVWLEDDWWMQAHKQNCVGCKMVKVYHKGGVDTMAEITATELGILKEIYPAVCTFPESLGHSVESCKIHYKTYPDYKGYYNHFWLYHYKPRNIQIAEACDVLYCIVPFIKNAYCFHHPLNAEPENSGFNHPKNGGCWTMAWARKLGKEIHLVVIE